MYAACSMPTTWILNNNNNNIWCLLAAIYGINRLFRIRREYKLCAYIVSLYGNGELKCILVTIRILSSMHLNETHLQTEHIVSLHNDTAVNDFSHRTDGSSRIVLEIKRPTVPDVLMLIVCVLESKASICCCSMCRLNRIVIERFD